MGRRIRHCRRMPFWVLGLLVPVLLITNTGFAADPPIRVGRLASIQGDVSWHPRLGQPWRHAALNTPIASDSAVWVAPGARAEIEFESVWLRLDAGTELAFADGPPPVLTLTQGRLDISLLPGAGMPASLVVATPRGTMTLMAPGRYRVTAGTASLATEIAVLAGQADLVGPGLQARIGPAEDIMIPPSLPPHLQRGVAIADAFDQWVGERDDAVATSHSGQFVAPGVPGLADLDQAGAWQTLPDYGPVWFPTDVAADWVPFREGRWRQIPPWGWTWFDAQPWGFAPMHYGRWVQVKNVWGWLPPPADAAYHPALVTPPAGLQQERIQGPVALGGYGQRP